MEIFVLAIFISTDISFKEGLINELNNGSNNVKANNKTKNIAKVATKRYTIQEKIQTIALQKSSES